MQSFILYMLLLTSSSGIIHGRVTDSSTGEPLCGAVVMIVGTDMGAMTDRSGMYTIKDLTEGTYVLKVRMVGMGEVTVEGVEVVPDVAVEQDFQLHLYSGCEYPGILIRI
ncbi:hypothetical protein CSA37_09210 [Candidatus Fermentibacteria bacterium]|nr:MAG: hypothetical protein CSA37_09210 [Candidatus Fermentibacteria bacterium]